MNDSTPLLADFLTRKDAAKELGVHPHTLVNWHVRRYGPRSVRIGKRAMYPRAEVRRWLDELVAKATDGGAHG